MKVFKHTKLLAAVLLASQSYQAHSLVYTLDITTESKALFLSDPLAAVTNTDSDSVSASSSAFISDSSASAYTRASGNSSGAFGLSASAYTYGALNDTFGSYSTLTQSYVVENDSALEQLFDFTFEIENGSINANCGGRYGGEDFFMEDGYGGGAPSVCEAGDSAGSGYEAEIFLNGDSIWNSNATVITDEAGSTFDLTNDLLGGNLFGNSYYWSAQSFTLDLGAFAAGETFTFDYVVSVGAAAELVGGSDVSAYAQFGDPNGFGASNIGPFSSVNAVPEPASLALMMSGLLGLGVAANRRRKTK